jgi:hypothetical protein
MRAPIIYASGMTAISDLRAMARARHPVGVVATLLRGLAREGVITRSMATLVGAVSRGVPAFVDSGAFTAFRRSEAVDWDHVLGVYSDLLDQLPIEHRHRLAIVMPDVVGDQQATLKLQVGMAKRIRSFISAGARVLVAIQKGGQDPSEIYAQLVALLGDNARFVVALPCNAAAFSTEEILAFAHAARPPALHLLGRTSGVNAIAAAIPSSIELSADANRLRAKLGAERPLTKTIRETTAARANQVADDVYTDLVGEIFQSDNALDPEATADLLAFIGCDAACALRHHPCGEHAGSSLGGRLLGHFWGSDCAASHSVWCWERSRARREIAPQVRTDAVAAAFGSKALVGLGLSSSSRVAV